MEALSTFEESHATNQSYSRSYRPECERVCTPVRTQTTETLRRGSYFRHGASGLTGRVDTVESMLAVSVYPAHQVKCGLFSARVSLLRGGAARRLLALVTLAFGRHGSVNPPLKALSSKATHIGGLNSDKIKKIPALP